MTKIIADYFKTQPVLKAWLFGSYARGEETLESEFLSSLTTVLLLDCLPTQECGESYRSVLALMLTLLKKVL